MFIDAQDISGQQAGEALAGMVSAPVIWPATGDLGKAASEAWANALATVMLGFVDGGGERGRIDPSPRTVRGMEAELKPPWKG